MDSLILALKATPAERLLLACICYRAASGSKGVCEDSNPDLAAIINIHYKTVSDLIADLRKKGFIKAAVDKGKANKRTIEPRTDLLEPYLKSFATYQGKTDSKQVKAVKSYPLITDSSEDLPDSDSPEKADSTNRNLRRGYPVNPPSYNKDLENSLENSSLENQQQQQADESADGDVDEKAKVEIELRVQKENGALPRQPKAEGQSPPPIPPPPLPTADEVRTALTESGKTKRYALENLKLITDEAGYQALIEKFISQRELDAENTGKPPFGPLSQTKHRFFNWLGKQSEIAQKTTNNGTHGKSTRSYGGRSERSLAIITEDDLRPGNGSTNRVIDVSTADTQSAGIGNVWEIGLQDLPADLE